MLNKFKKVMLCLILPFLALAFSACGNPYDKLKINISSSLTISESGEIYFNRETSIENNKFTVSATVSGKDVSTELITTVDKADIVKISEPIIEGNKTTVNCEAVGGGTALIKFVAFGGKSATIIINVNEPLRDLSIDSTYKPAAVVGKTTRFDVTKVLFNKLTVNAVDCNSMYKVLTYSSLDSRVQVDSVTGQITIPAGYTGTEFQFKITPKNANVNLAKTITIPVIKMPLIEEINNNGQKTIDFTSGGTIFATQKNADKNLIDVDLALFPTDLVHKVATIKVNYQIPSIVQSELNTNKATYKFVEVNEKGELYTSGLIEKRINNLAPNVLNLNALNREGSTIVNVYVAYTGFEESTEFLLARIKINVQFMPNSQSLFDENGNKITTSHFDIYNSLSTINYRKIDLKIYEGSRVSTNAHKFIIVKESLLNVVNIHGAVYKEKTEEGSHYEINNDFGFSVKDNITLEQIASISDKTRTVIFYSKKDLNFGNINRTISFVEAKSELVLTLKLGIEKVAFSSPESAEGDLIHNVNVATNRGSLDESIEIPFNVFPESLGNNSEYLESILTFNFENSSMNALVDFRVDYINKKLIITPKLEAVGVAKIFVNSFGIDKTKNYITVNCFIKPSKYVMKISDDFMKKTGDNGVYEFSIPMNSRTVGSFDPYFGLTMLGDIEFIVKKITDNNGDVPVWAYISGNKNNQIVFNAAAATPGVYELMITLADAGGNEITNNVKVTIYKELVPSDVYIQAYQGNNEDIGTANEIASLWQPIRYDNLFTKSSVAFSNETNLSNRSFRVSVNGFDETDYAVSFLTCKWKLNDGALQYLDAPTVSNGYLADFNDTLLIQTKNKTGKVLLTFEVEQFDRVVVRSIEINISDKQTVKPLSDIIENLVPAEKNDDGVQVYNINVDNKHGIPSDFNLNFKINTNAENKTIIFNSTDLNVVTVDSKGKIKFVGVGRASINVYAHDSTDKSDNYESATNKIKINVTYSDGLSVPYQVNSLQDLNDMANSSANFELAQNINLMSVFSPIKGFTGNLDGKNHIIYGVNLSANLTENAAVGIFETVKGKISNLHIIHENININANNHIINFGVVAGSIVSGGVFTGSQFENVSVAGRVDNNIKSNVTISDFVNSTSVINPICGGTVTPTVSDIFYDVVLNSVSFYKAENTIDFATIEFSNNLNIVNENGVDKAQIEFTFGKPIDFSKLFVFKDLDHSIITNPNVIYSINKNAQIVNNFGVVTTANEAIVTVTNKLNPLITKNLTVLFVYNGQLPTRTLFNYEVRKNYDVVIKPVTSVFPFTTTFKIADIDGITPVEAVYNESNNTFNSTKAGSYKIIEQVIHNTYGVVIENIITVNVVEGVQSMAANIISGSASIAPWESLIIDVTINSDKENEDEPIYVVYKGSPISSDSKEDSNVKVNLISKKGNVFKYFVNATDESKANGKYTIRFTTNSNANIFTDVIFEFYKAFPSYVEVNAYEGHITDTEQIKNSAPSNEFSPAFTFGNETIGGKSTLSLSLFPEYISNNFKIFVKTVKNLSQPNSVVPLPVAADGISSPLVDYELTEQNGMYLLPMNFAQTIIQNGEFGIANSGDIYQFTFEIKSNTIGGTSKIITKNLEVIYPLFISGSFSDKTDTKIDTVAYGTQFSIDVSVVDTNIDVGSSSQINCVADASIFESLSSVKIDNGYRYTFKLIKKDYANAKFDNKSIRFTASKMVGGRTIKSNELNFIVKPVMFEITDIKIAKMDSFGQLIDLTNPAQLALSTMHKFKIRLNVEHALSKNVAAELEILNSITQIEKDINSFLPYFSYSINGIDYFQFENGPFTVKNYFEVIGDPVNGDTDYRIIFATVGDSIKLKINAGFTLINGLFAISRTNEGNNIYSYSQDVTLSIFASSNDDTPLPINSANDLKKHITTNLETPQSPNETLILINDITIDATWLAGLPNGVKTFAAMFKSLDGNNKTIFINENALNGYLLGFAESDKPTVEKPQNIGLFTEIGANTIIKNLNIEVVGSSKNNGNENTWRYAPLTDATFNVEEIPSFNFGLIAGVNNGVVTNSQVSFGGNDSITATLKGITVYPFPANVGSSTAKVSSANIGELFGVNNGFITNCSAQSDILCGGSYLSSDLNNYVSNGTFKLGGLVGINNKKIASSRVLNSNVVNGVKDDVSAITGGFVAENFGEIAYSYAEGSLDGTNIRSKKHVKSNTNVSGFVYLNHGFVSNSYSNLTLIGDQVAGFVQMNGELENIEVNAKAKIENCLSLSDIIKYSNLGFRPFTGSTKNTIDNSETINNFGTISSSYYLGFLNSTHAGEVPSLQLNEISDIARFTGFAFANNERERAVWFMENINSKNSEFPVYKPSLFSANIDTNPTRINTGSYTDPETGNITYSYAYEVEYGSSTNPVIVYDVASFNKIADVHNNNSFYRLIKDITFDSGANKIKTLNTKFGGELDGNGMNINNLIINFENKEGSTSGMFASLEGQTHIIDGNEIVMSANVKALKIDVAELYASQIAYVGVVAGIVNNANLFNINVSSANNTVVHGKNIVGGVAGLITGNSRVYGVVSSVDVVSTFIGASVSIDEIGLVSATSSLLTKNNGKYNVSEVSYAGGVLGVYAGNTVNTIPVLSSLRGEGCRVEGGVAGGVAGAILNSGFAVDLSYKADLNTSLLKGRIAVGGIVGENRGRLMFVRSEHTDEVQNSIDNVANLEKIFSQENQNKILFGNTEVYAAGGIVGININGAIKHSYSRLNINNTNAGYAGGIVGVSNGGNLDTIYSTGSLVATFAIGGIVGMQYGDNDVANVLNLSNVAAINTYNETALNYLSQFKVGENIQFNIGGIIGLISKSSVLSSKITDGKSVIVSNKKNTSEDYLSSQTSEDLKTPYNKYSSSITALFKDKYTFAKFNSYNIEYIDLTNENKRIEQENQFKQTGDNEIIQIQDYVLDETNPANKEKLTISNTILQLSSEENFKIARKKLFGAFYGFENGNWQSFENALDTKTTFPKIVNFSNYLGNTFIISSYDDLVSFANSYVENSMATVKISQGFEVPENSTILPIGKGTDTPFRGRFESDSNQVVIKTNGKALFENLNGAIFKNITVETLTVSERIFGGFAQISTSTQFINCRTIVSSSTVSELQSIGGIVGHSFGNNSFVNCTTNFVLGTANQDITTDLAAGGFIGVGEGSSDLFFDCNANISINISKSGQRVDVGGFVGKTSSVTIKSLDTTKDMASGSISIKENGQTTSGGNVEAADNATNVGGFIGYAGDTGNVSNATGAVNIIVNNVSSGTDLTNNYIGGIGGLTANTNYDNCTLSASTKLKLTNSNGSTLKQIYYVGGIAGSAGNVSYSYIDTIETVLDVNANGFVGGLVGMLNGTMTVSYFDGDISSNANIGGLVGFNNSSATIQKSFSMGTISGIYAAGITVENKGAVNDCYSTMRVTATEGAAGLVYTNKEGSRLSNSYYAGRNMTGKISKPLYQSNDNATISNIIYCKDFGFNSINTDSSSSDFNVSGGRTAGEMLNEVSYKQSITVLNDKTSIDSASTDWVILKDNGSFAIINPSKNSENLLRTAFIEKQFKNNSIIPLKVKTVKEIADNSTGFLIIDSNLTFDGSADKNTIQKFSGILISSSEYKVTLNVPMFVSLDNATVFNLQLEGTLNASASLATSATNSSIDGCDFSGTLTCTTTDNIGGLVQKAKNSTITNCFVDGTINASNSGSNYVGGLVGELIDSSINRCFFSGIINSNVVVARMHGGIIGKGTNSIVKNVYNIGSFYGNTSVESIIGSKVDTQLLSFYDAAFVDGKQSYSLLSINGKQTELKNSTNYSYERFEWEQFETSKFPKLRGFARGQELGTKVNPRIISSFNDLQNMQSNPNAAYILGENINGTNFITKSSSNQTDDNLKSFHFEPIQNFNGTFYGNGKTITGLFISNKKNDKSTNRNNDDGTERDNLGMFANLTDNAIIRDLQLEKVEMYTSNVVNSGFVAGFAGEKSRIINPTIKNSKLLAAPKHGVSAINLGEAIGTSSTGKVIGLTFADNKNNSSKTSVGDVVSSIKETFGLRGDGSEKDPYLIASAADFLSWLSKKNVSSSYSKLTADIDFNGHVINDGTSAKFAIENFSGEFNGQYHTIYNFDSLGFIKTNSGTIKNVNFYNAIIRGGTNDPNIGAIAQENGTNGEIINVFVSGLIVKRENVGSIVAINNGTITNSFGSVYLFGGVLTDGTVKEVGSGNEVIIS